MTYQRGMIKLTENLGKIGVLSPWSGPKRSFKRLAYNTEGHNIKQWAVDIGLSRCRISNLKIYGCSVRVVTMALFFPTVIGSLPAHLTYSFFLLR